MRVAFRVDAGPVIGTGHLARCRVLAGTLRREASAETLFLCRGLPGEFVGDLRRDGFDVFPLAVSGAGAPDPDGPPHRDWLAVTQQADADGTAAAMSERGWSGADWLVVDHYALDARWERSMRSRARRILAIDDLADRDHDVDLLLDQNLREDGGAAYAGRLRPDARRLLGPRYALLREEFARVAANPAFRDEARRVFVCFGGSDAGNATTAALQALEHPSLGHLRVDVVIGRAHPAREALEQRTQRERRFRLHIDPPAVAPLMHEADVAIGGGGVMTWERCAAGLPAIAWPIAANQRSVLGAAAAAGAILLVDDGTWRSAERLAAQIAVLAGDAGRRRGMAEAGRRLCDGLGASRVYGAMRATGHLAVRPATIADRERVHAWRNHPGVRQTAFNPEPIPEDAHARWFSSVLDDDARDLLIGEIEGEPFGVVRYDRDRERQAEVSIYLAPEWQGSGLGSALLRAGDAWLRRSRPDVSCIVARIRAGNEPSRRMFERNGYERNGDLWRQDLSRTNGDER